MAKSTAAAKKAKADAGKAKGKAIAKAKAKAKAKASKARPLSKAEKVIIQFNRQEVARMQQQQLEVGSVLLIAIPPPNLRPHVAYMLTSRSRCRHVGDIWASRCQHMGVGLSF